jgi:hypothetical protein
MPFQHQVLDESWLLESVHLAPVIPVLPYIDAPPQKFRFPLLQRDAKLLLLNVLERDESLFIAMDSIQENLNNTAAGVTENFQAAHEREEGTIEKAKATFQENVADKLPVPTPPLELPLCKPLPMNFRVIAPPG